MWLTTGISYKRIWSVPCLLMFTDQNRFLFWKIHCIQTEDTKLKTKQVGKMWRPLMESQQHNIITSLLVLASMKKVIQRIPLGISQVPFIISKIKPCAETFCLKWSTFSYKFFKVLEKSLKSIFWRRCIRMNLGSDEKL